MHCACDPSRIEPDHGLQGQLKGDDVKKYMIKEWNLAYIVDHWVRVIALMVLIFTGFYIQWPFITGGPGSYIMAWMRFSHFIAAYVFVLGLLVRVYLAFRSTFDADWKDFNVIQAIKNIPDIAGYYLFIKGTHKDYRKYNPMQALSYLFTGAMIIFSALTGFALYHGNVFGIIPAHSGFRWVITILGGESYTRMWHILTMWYFIIFLAIHVYMSNMVNFVNKDGTLTSIFTGYKRKTH
jgi:Ni/Fe-hydrogenase 1 B-type cytochrome subunit